MTSRTKRKVTRAEEFRAAPEVIEFCRIIARVLRRTPQHSLVDVEGADQKSDENVDCNNTQ